MGLTYKDTGVDIDKGDQFVEIIKKRLPPKDQANIGLFGGLFDISSLGYKNPVLVSSTDGVGTKLLVAREANKFDAIGIDLVAMCVNDVIPLGAKPLFFLDYLATAYLDLETATTIIDGILEGCRQAGCSLLGGETAEMPGVYREGDYELAGFTVGIVERDKIIYGKTIIEGDALVGIRSSGIHSNGLSLARAALVNFKFEESLLQELLVPTRIYVKLVLDLLTKTEIKGIAHITGGGIYGNTKRLLPKNLDLNIHWDILQPQPIFKILQEAGNIEDEEMRKTFNLGVGMVFIVNLEKEKEFCSLLTEMGEEPISIGEVVKQHI
jgi:phosphoribosylformylglycinamidine cyclo-ligase